MAHSVDDSKSHRQRVTTRRRVVAGRMSLTRLSALAVALLVAAGALAACSSSANTTSAGAISATHCSDPAAIAAINKYTSSGEVLGKGPYGETATPPSAVQLTPDEIAKVRAMHATVAIVMHFAGDSWSNAQVAALQAEFSTLGIKVVAHTDAQALASKQFNDIQSVLALKPNLMVSIPSLDVNALAPAYKQAAAQGVKIVFMENNATGMHPGVSGADGYVSVVSMDNYGGGVIAAHEMANALCGKGTVGVIFHAAKAPSNVLREQGFLDTIKADYPNIKVVASQGLLGPDWSGEGETTVNAWLTRYPSLSGVYCWFDAPCEGAINAAKSDGRPNLVTTNIDLGPNVADDMASNQFVAGIAAAQPYSQGTTEAELAAYALLGKPAPPFVEFPAIPVTRANVLSAWNDIYQVPAPQTLTQAYNSAK